MPETMDASIHELLLETAKSINSEIEIEKLVQRITDIGTEISGAEFGAFFYNVINNSGEKYLLYTISGVPKEAFSKFPNPRNTEVFHPTFSGQGTVRYDDVTKQPHYGKNDPHFGMPKGHLPVKSYLATPVISPVTKEVIGGLFFGHSMPAIFTDKSQKLVEGIAVQAAIAMGNAELFEAKKKTEEILKEQKEQYRSIFQSTTDAMLIFNDAGNIVEANTAASALTGYSSDELKSINGKILFQDSEQLFEAILSITNSGRQFGGIGRLCINKGDSLDVKIIVTHYVHLGSNHLLFVIKRIDTKKEIEEALIRSENFSQTITHVSPVTLWMTNDKAETIYINPTWLDLVGGQLEDHLGMGWLEVITDEDRERAGTVFMEAFNNKKVFTQDFRIKRRDGSIRWCSSHGSPYYMHDGSFGGFAGSLTDITDRKNAEQQLASQHILLNTITNNTLHALFLMDARQHCTYMNPAAEQMTGFKTSEVKDKPLHYYIHHTHADGRHFPLEDCPIDRALPERMQTTGEEVFIRKSGEFFPVAFVASPIVEGGVPIGTVIEVRETTQEKKVQEELRNRERQAMQLLEEKVKERTAELEKINYELMQFTSVASHDLKEPVRKMAIFSQRSKELAKDFDNDQFHQYMDNVIRSSKRLASLIDDLLAFARLSHAEALTREVDLNKLLHQITDDLQIAINEKHATIHINDLPIVKGIELHLGQVFQNLISNSLKFSHPGRPPVIDISACKNEGFHIIKFTDNGIGFDNNMSDRIFEVFERLHSKDQYEGTGIGLSIVKKIIDLHGGSIAASGKPGEGVVFEIMFPL